MREFYAKPAEAGVRTGDNVSSEAHTMEELLEIQRAAFLRDGIPDAKTRIDRINRLQALLLDNSDGSVRRWTPTSARVRASCRSPRTWPVA